MARRGAKPSATDRLWTPANVVTLVRICLVPVFVLALISPWPSYFGLGVSPELKMWVAAAIFIVLAATDGLDGYLARSRGEVTDFGKFMDPLADKILVAAALLSLIELGVLPSWPALIILTREFIVSGIRMVAASKGVVIAASWYGKAKTVTQIIAIVLFIVKDSVVIVDAQGALGDPLYLVSWAFMIVAVVLTIVSMLDYFVKARHLLGFSASSEKDSGALQTDTGCQAAALPNKNVSFKDCTLIAERVIALACACNAKVATAESLTGGLIAAALTAVPGSSSVVNGGVVSYINDVKHAVLGVSDNVLKTVGAVSKQTALQMAEGSLAQLDATVAVSVTGIAGPGGEEPGKPVGTVWMGIACKNRPTRAKRFQFSGDRASIRLQTAYEALLEIERCLETLEPR